MRGNDSDYRHVAMGYATAAIEARGHLERWRVNGRIAKAGRTQRDRDEAIRCAGGVEALEAFTRHMEELCIEYERRALSAEAVA